MDKVVNLEKAVSIVKNGSTIMFGGFSQTGSPRHLIRALGESGVVGLHTISDDLGVTRRGYDETLSVLVKNRQIASAVCSFIGENPQAGNLYMDGKLDITFYPMGTFVEKIRAGGSGIGGFYTKTGVGTVVAEGKETKEINGETYLLELPLHADIAFVKAYMADSLGNAVFKYTAQNYNFIMAMAADIVVLEVEKVVAPGVLDPNHIQLPGVFVDYIVEAEEDIL